MGIPQKERRFRGESEGDYFSNRLILIMCGIAGICHINGPDGLSLDSIKRMIGALCHRGPDETGIYIDDQVALGHARLSIIDLSSGVQPIHNEDKNLWIVYNGEIFNYPELKKDLLQKGHRFYTTSDTEVLLHLYEEQGTDCLTQLNGQFALAIWDAKKKELFLARDRVGIRPLYYTIFNNMLIFGSEIKSIFENRNVSRQIDPIAMDQIFTFWTTLTPRTVFKDIYELPPGHYMKACDGKVTFKKYWDIPLYPRSEQSDLAPQEICRQIQQLLQDAVRIRLRADVPVGCYLSGGLDSSGATALVVRNFNKDVRTFGIRFDSDGYDEGEYQSLMVSHLNVNHTDLRATNEQIGASLPDCLWHCEKPLLRTGPIPLFLLSDVVRKSGYKVVLTGEGADEVFGGYNIFREAKVRRFLAKYPHSHIRAELIGRLYPYIFKNPKLKCTLQSFFARGLDQIDDPVFSHFIRWESTKRIKTFFSQELNSAVGQYDGYEQVRQSLPESFGQADDFSKAQYLEMAIFLSNYLLSSQGDRVAMAHSLEIRVPFLDPRVINFMAKVPAKWKILGLNEKHILKKSFEGILPKEITSRPKNPYRAPIKQSLLNEKTAEYTKEVLSAESLGKTGLFDAGKVTRLLRKAQAVENLSEIDSMALVGILSSQIIHSQFVQSFTGVSADSVAPALIVDRRSKTSMAVS
ncbi:MAG: asparagine synthase (glutamine-hydrolyzing) [Sedimentisphaerales bacterium]|nr:asparagine synthase (glutamine-hydrolyzing) [Sedimentisphaerales bacterium]